MTVAELRAKHPRLIYHSYDINQRQGVLVVRHEFLLEPNIVFHPEVVIPFSGVVDEKMVDTFAFHLGLIEAISYWKAACPAEFVVEAGEFNSEQIRWWQDLFLHGLGEFFYQNNIDFTQPGFLRIINAGAEVGAPFLRLRQASLHSGALSIREGRGAAQNAAPPHADSTSHFSLLTSSDLVLVGGGKDSAVTLGLLKDSGWRPGALMVNPTQAARDNVKAAGINELFVVKRTIDPKLLELNDKGYLNGHTPFSAYLAFLGVLVAALHGFENVVVSNEASASEGNVVYRGMEVNHQYSKSFRFEQLFREYSQEQLFPIPGINDFQFRESVNYFSLLRPLNEMQISQLFSQLPQFFSTFRSCNAGRKTNSWCGACAKCAFSYMTLFPFVDYGEMLKMFGVDYYTKPEISGWIQQLVGLIKHKPFECVGTKDEARLALALSVAKYKESSMEVPEGLLTIWSKLGLTEAVVAGLKEAVIDTWGESGNLPPEHLALLRSAWDRVSTVARGNF